MKRARVNKCGAITVRLTKAERAKLERLAKEAGLTCSAVLRQGLAMIREAP
jgi:uncharacterized protein YbaP (TraB family)